MREKGLDPNSTCGPTQHLFLHDICFWGKACTALEGNITSSAGGEQFLESEREKGCRCWRMDFGGPLGGTTMPPTHRSVADPGCDQ